MVFLSCLVALAICVTLRRKLNNVREKVQANEYITPGGLRLADSYDRYTHTTKTRTKIERKVRMAAAIQAVAAAAAVRAAAGNSKGGTNS